MGLTFSVTSLGPGSITAELAGDGTHVQLTASYLSDALGDLTRVVIGLLRGAPRARCAWQEEPGEHRWLFERAGNRVHLRVLWFPRTFSKQPDDVGRCVFSTTCTLASFAGQLKSQLDRLLGEHGVEGYQARWKTYPFPMAEYEHLRSLIRSRRRGVSHTTTRE